MPAQPPSSPQVGFNNNVKHRGRVFHIQTEDSGVNRPHLTTHLFVDGGRIIRSTRTDYSELVGRHDVGALVRKRMKDQHKAMFVALRRGQLDEVIEGALSGAKPASDEKPAEASSERGSLPVPISTKAPRNGSTAPKSRPPVKFTRPRAPSLLGIEASEAKAVSVQQLPPISIPSEGDARAKGGSGGTRPALASSADSSSLYGEGKIGEKSLDDVILSYISDDLTPSDEA